MKKQMFPCLKSVNLKNNWPHMPRLLSFEGYRSPAIFGGQISCRYSTSVELPCEADVVVIGGGVMGCFTLFHLARMGCKGVLLERYKLTCGTTWHTNGLLWRIRPSEIDTALLNSTRNTVLELERDGPAGWIRNGGLFIASNKLRLEEYARLYTIGRTAGVECQLLTPEEVKDLYPLMNVEDVVGALYSPGDGVLDPSTLCTSLTRHARKMGAKVFEGVDVTGLELEEGQVMGQMVKRVITNCGPIKTQAVVNCAGVWSEDLLKLCGTERGLPLVGMEHCIVVMEPISGVRHLPNVRDHDANMCLRVQGDSLVIGGYELNASTCKVDQNFSFGLFDFNMDSFSEIIEGAIHRVPQLAETGIKARLCGPEAFTPDRKPLLGEDWEVRGLYHCCGFNSSGMMLSGGCSEQLAHWIIHGRPSRDMFSYDCTRFPKRVQKWRKWSEERSHEAYTSNYSIVFPSNQHLAARQAITDSLHETLTNSGCFWEESLGWERPGFFMSMPLQLLPYDWKGAFGNNVHDNYPYRNVLQMGHTFNLPLYYEQIREEYRALTETSAIINRSSAGKIAFDGKDVEAAINWLFLEDIRKEGGSFCSSLILNKRGGIEAEVTVYTLDETTRLSCEDKARYFLQCDSGKGPYVRRLIRSMCMDKEFDVSLNPLTEIMSNLLLVGPSSYQILQAIGINVSGIPMNTHVIRYVKNTPVRVSRLAGDMWEIHMAEQDLLAVYETVIKCGTNVGLRNAGYRALSILNLENDVPSWHTDFRSDDTPLEAGLLSVNGLNSKKRDFIGKEALLHQVMHGISRIHVKLEAPGCPSLCGNEGIVRDGQLVGIVRRADQSFSRDAPIAVGYVNIDNTLPHTSKHSLQASMWEIERMGKRYPAILL